MDSVSLCGDYEADENVEYRPHLFRCQAGSLDMGEEDHRCRRLQDGILYLLVLTPECQ
jgi:hypothetical protein